jgi:CheY-like chemotaxis protein
LHPHITVYADAGRMEQVLVNLLTNAAKYTLPGGRIDVIAERADGEIMLTVRDNGIGISAEMLPEVFDPFSQANRSLDRSEGGLGLGLALVQRLVELHGGRVEARSEGCGQGAEFVVRLRAPAGPAPEPEPADSREARKPGAASGKAARVLVVDDNVDAAASLAMLLEILGHTVDVAHDGLAALETMQRSKPDVVLMDICLPTIDGFEVARRARMLPSGKYALLVALTGCGRDEDKERSRAAGFDYHLTKPVDIDALKNLVASFEPSVPTPDEAHTLH